MARPASPERDDAIRKIRNFVRESGVKEGIRLARDQFPSIPSATWARWRQAAVGNVSVADSQAMAGLSDAVKSAIPAPEKLIPASVDPVSAARHALNFWRMLDELEHDVQLLRDYALAKGNDGKTRVRVPFALRDAHRMRCDLLRFGLQQAEVAYGVDRSARLFQAVIDAVGEESPECQRRIIAQLSQLQTEHEARGF